MDSFQIALAYSIYSDLWNAGGLTKRDRTPRTVKPRNGDEPYTVDRRSASCQLSKLRFFAGMGVGYDSLKAEFGQEFNGEFSDAVECYLGLVERHEGPAAAMLEGDELNAEFYVNDSTLTLWQARQLIGIERAANLHKVLELNKHKDNGAKLSVNTIMGEPHVILEGCRPLVGIDKIVMIFPVVAKEKELGNLACPKCGGRQFSKWEPTEEQVDAADGRLPEELYCDHCDSVGFASDFDADDAYEKSDSATQL